MTIYFINICSDWLYNLYKEYLLNIKFFIEKNHSIAVSIKRIENFEFNSIDEKKKLDIKNIIRSHKTIFLGNMETVNNIYKCYSNKNDDTSNFYYLNIEQMSHPSYHADINKKINTNINIIDYSEENIPFLKQTYNKTYLLPPIFYNTCNKKENKNIDIISLSNNLYRRNILKNLQKNFNITLLDNIFGKERDNLFKKSKVYINLHASEKHKTMELIRIINLLKHNVIVLSQQSIHPDLLYVKDSILFFENMEQLNLMLTSVLNHYSTYYNKLFNTTNMKNYEQYVNNNMAFLLEK